MVEPLRAMQVMGVRFSSQTPYVGYMQIDYDSIDVSSIPSGQPKRSVILTVKNSIDNRKIEVRPFYRPP